MPYDGMAPAGAVFTEPTTCVVLHGELAKKYGRRHNLGVKTAAQAAHALAALHPGFRQDFAAGHYKVIRGSVANGIPLTVDMLNMRIGKVAEIHFIPVARGASSGKGVGKIIVGAVILVAAVAVGIATGGAAIPGEIAAYSSVIGVTSLVQVGFFGAAILLGGISQVISAQNKNNSNSVDPKTSFGLSGPTNSTTQGTPIPVVYGRTRVGSVVGSFGYEAVDFSGSITTTPASGDSTGGSSPAISVTDVSINGGAVGSGGGGKGGSSSGANEAPNTLRSDAVIRVIDILSEGPIGGLVNGAQSIFFNNTPLMASDGSYNFQGVSWDVRLGYPDQDPVPGYPAAEETVQVGVQVKQLLPITRTITSETANAARVTIRIPALAQQNTTNGDLLAGPQLAYVFEVRPAGGAWISVVSENLNGQKCTSPYQRSYRIALPDVGTATSWDIRMTRQTPDSTTTAIQNDTYWDAITIITDHQLIYPNTAYIALTIDAAAFGSQIPTRAYEIDGILCQVPLNYDAINHQYSTTGPGTSMGTWDGASWTLAPTSNPCWCLYDMLSNVRYGVGLPAGSSLSSSKFDLFTISQYCDGMVPTGYLDSNGNATTELRYAMNVAMTTQDDAYRVLQSMVSSFRGMIYWGAGSVVVTADMPTIPSALMSQANVIDGDFVYEGTSLKTRHTVARVQWLDPNNSYLPAIEVVEDFDQVVTLGQVSTDIAAFGVTSRGLAHRLGKWMLDTEKTQTDTMSCKVALEHLSVRPGDVVRVADPHYAGVRMGGRCRPGSTTSTINLDSTFPTSGELAYTMSILLPDGTLADQVAVAAIGVNSAINGPYNIATLQSPIAAAPQSDAAWILTSIGTEAPHGPYGLYPIVDRQFRILAVTEPQRATFAMIGAFHDPNKYARVEYGLKFDPTPYSDLGQLLAAPLPAPSNVTARDYIAGVGNTTLVRATVSFTAVYDPRIVGTEVRAVGPEQRSQTVTGASADFDGLQLGTYVFGARSIGRDGRASVWVDSESVLVDGVADAPAAITNLSATGGALSVTLSWNGSTARDIQYYEVWRAGSLLNGQHPFPVTEFTPTGTPDSNNAVLVTKVAAITYTDIGDELGPDEAWAYWVRPVNTTLVPGAFVGPVAALTTYYLTDNLEQAIRNTAPIAQALLGQAPLAVQTLPASGIEGQLAFQASDQKLYKWSSAANNGNGAWVLYIPVIPDDNGKIPASIVTGIEAAVLGASLTQDQVNQVLAAVSAQSITSDQIVSVAGSKVSGTLTNAQITAGRIFDVDSNGNVVQGINTSNLLGTLNASSLPAIPTSKLTGDILANSTATLNLQSSQVTGNLQAARISGQLAANQISQISSTQISGQLSDAQVAGLAAAKITGAIQGTQIGASQISTGNIAAGAVQTANLAAGAVTANNLAIGSSTNVIWNASCVVSADGWVSASSTLSPTIGANPAGYSPTGEGAGFITSTGTLGVGQYIAALWLPSGSNGVAVSGGQWVEAQAMLGAHRCAGYVELNFFDSSGLLISTLVSARVSNVGGGPQLNQFGFAWVKGQAPSNAVTMRVSLVGINDGQTDYWAMGSPSVAGVNPYLFWTRALLGISTPVPQAQSQPQSWAPGGLTQITGGMIETGTVVARNIAGQTITGNLIAANTIQGTNIAAQTITATNLAAASVTAAQLAVGSPNNVIANSCFAYSADGWEGNLPTPVIGTADEASCNLDGQGAGRLQGVLAPGQTSDCFYTAGASTTGRAFDASVPCTPGETWEAQVAYLPNYGAIELYLIFADANGQLASATSTGIVSFSPPANGLMLSDWQTIAVRATAPSSAITVGMILRLHNNTNVTADVNILVTRALLGKTVPNATGPLPWTPGGLTSVAGGLIQTDAIVSRHIASGSITTSELAANSVTTAQLAVGSSSNLLQNSCCAVTTDGWTAIQNQVGFYSTASAYSQYATEDGCGVVLTRLPAGLYCDIASDSVAITSGQWLEAQVMLLPQASIGSVFICFEDANHVIFAYSAESNRVPQNYTPTGLGSLAPFGLASVIAQAPANAASAHLLIRFASPQGGEADGFGVFTRAGLGPTVPNATQVSAWTPGGITSVSGGMIETNAVVARTIAAGAVTADKLTVASASNVIANPTCPVSAWGWVLVATAPGAQLGSVTGDGLAAANFALLGEGSGVLTAPSEAVGQAMVAYWDPDATGGVACLPGDWWEGQAYFGAHRCAAYVYLTFWNAGGNILLSIAGNRVAGPTGGQYLSGYGFSWVKAQAPAGAARVRLELRAIDDGGTDISAGTPGQNPYLFFTRCVLGLSTSLPIAAGAQPQPYQIGGATQIVGGQIKTGAIVARNIGAGEITAEKLAIGSSSNVIWNGCGYPSVAGWQSIENQAWITSQAPTEQWGLAGYGSLQFSLPDMSAGAIHDVVWSPNPYPAGTPFGASIPCGPGELWEAQAKVITERCSATLYLLFTGPNGAGGYIQTGGATSPSTSSQPPADGHSISEYTQLSVRDYAPAGTTAVILLLRAGNDATAAAAFSDHGSQPAIFFTQAGLGPVSAPNSAQPVPWAPGGVTSINGGVIQTGSISSLQLAADSVTAVNIEAGAVTAGKLAAGAVTAESLAVGSSSNLIWNSCPDQGPDGWSIYTFGPGMPPVTSTINIAMGAASAIGQGGWALSGLGSGFSQYTGAASTLIQSNQGFVWDWSPNVGVTGKLGVPCGGDSRTYGGAASIISANGCIASCQLIFVDANNTAVNVVSSQTVVNNAGSAEGAFEDGYTRVSVIGAAPPGAVGVILRVVGTGAVGGSGQPLMVFTKAQLANLPTGSTVMGDWAPGGVTTISGNMLKTGSLDANRINVGTLAAATGFIETLTAQTVNATTIKANLLGANKLTADEINADTLTIGAVKAGAIGSDQIAGNAIYGRHIAADQIISLALQVGVGVINAASIQDATIQNAKIADLTVDGVKIKPSAISETSIGFAPGGYADQQANSAVNVTAWASGVVIMVRTFLASNIQPDVIFVGGGGEGT